MRSDVFALRRVQSARTSQGRTGRNVEREPQGSLALLFDWGNGEITRVGQGVRSEEMPERVQAHRRAARTHDAAVRTHVEAAEHWHKCGDDELAALEERSAEIEQMAANLENDRADLRAMRIAGPRST